jgi:diacylglycerol kinase family enzyme
VRQGDGAVVDDGYFGICFNTNPYTFFGNRPLDLAPEADLERGLVMLTFRSLGATKVLRVAGEALSRKRGIGRHRFVDYRTDLERLQVEGYGPLPYQVDGDYLGDIEHLSFRHEPSVLRLVLPQ